MAFLIVPLGAALAGRNAAAQRERPVDRRRARRGDAASRLLAPHRSFFVCGFQTVFVMTHLPAYRWIAGLTSDARHDGARDHRLLQHHWLIRRGCAWRPPSKKALLAWLYAVRAVAIAISWRCRYGRGHLCLRRGDGLTWLGTVPLTNSLVGQIFGVKYLSTLFSISFLGHQLGGFIGAWAGGAVFDATHSYQIVWLASIALSVIAAALCLPIDERAIVRPALQGPRMKRGAPTHARMRRRSQAKCGPCSHALPFAGDAERGPTVHVLHANDAMRAAPSGARGSAPLPGAHGAASPSDAACSSCRSRRRPADAAPRLARFHARGRVPRGLEPARRGPLDGADPAVEARRHVPRRSRRASTSIAGNVARVLAITRKLGDFSRVGGEAPAPQSRSTRRGGGDRAAAPQPTRRRMSRSTIAERLTPSCWPGPASSSRCSSTCC